MSVPCGLSMIDSMLQGLGDRCRCIGDRALRPTGLVEDSRQVRPGMLFIARPGTDADGARFIEPALEAGAVGLVVAEGSAARFEGDPRVGVLIETDDPATLGARLAHRFHGNPADRLDVVAITGTNGKTTVAWFVRALLQAAGRSCGLVGTIETDDGRTRAPPPYASAGRAASVAWRPTVATRSSSRPRVTRSTRRDSSGSRRTSRSSPTSAATTSTTTAPSTPTPRPRRRCSRAFARTGSRWSMPTTLDTNG